MAKRHGSALVWTLYGLGLLPALWSFYLGSTGGLGADPVKAFEHALGLWALRFLILTLMVSPLRDLFSVNLLRYRRALGLLAFYYAAMHFSVYMILDQALDLNAVVADIVKRPFITIGMASLVLLVPLAVTSNSWSIRRLGRNWVTLHRLVYLAAAGGAIHFILSKKSWQAEPVIYAAIIAGLLLWRAVRPRRRSPSPLRGGWPEGSGGGGDVCATVVSKSTNVTTPIRPLHGHLPRKGEG